MKNYKKVLALIIFVILVLSMVGLGLSGAIKIKDYNQNEEIITIADSFAESVNVTSNETHIFLDNGNFDIEMEYIDFFVPSELQDNLRYVTPCDSPNGFYCQGNHSDEIYGTDKLFHIKTDPNAGEDNFYALVDYLFDYESSGSDVSSAVDFIIYSAGQGNSILYAVDDVVIYDSKYYNCKQQIFNYNGIPTSLTQYWEEIQPGERTDVPEGFGWKRINYEFTMNPNQNNLNNIIMSSYGSANDINISLVSNGYDIIQTWDYYNEGTLTASYNKIYQGAEASYQLLSNECDENFRFCNATIKTNLRDEGKLLDAIDFQINKVRWYKIYMNTTGEKLNITDYNFTCENEINMTNCSNEIVGYHLIDSPDWTLYQNQNITGEKIWKIEAEKRPSWMSDWVISKLIDGNLISFPEWATWGNISGGDDAEVILNSPDNNLVSQLNNETFNCSAEINESVGSTLTNISLWNDFNGTWQINETVIISQHTNNPWGGSSTPSTAGAYNGYRFTVNKKVKLISFSGTASNAVIVYYANDSILTTSVGKTFSNTTLYPSINYYIQPTSNENHHYDNTGIIYPHSSTDITYTMGIGAYSYPSTQFEQTAYYTSITNIVTEPYYTKGVGVWQREINNNMNWTCSAGDSDGVIGFAIANRTILLNDAPKIGILSPSALLTSNTFDLRLNISDDLDNLSSCSFNITRGASTEFTNTDLNISQYPLINYTNITLSSEASYVLNLFCNDSIGNENTTNFPFAYSIPVIPPTGGGGGSSTPLPGEAEWTMETSPGQFSYDKRRPLNTEKDLSIDFISFAEGEREITFACRDLTGDACKFVSFNEEEFTLLPIKDSAQRGYFTITTDDVRGDYSFNIIALDNLGKSRGITVDLQVGGLGLLAVFYKLGLNSTGGVPYAVVFFPVIIGIFLLFYTKVLEKVPVRSIWSMLIAFLIASGSIAFW